MDPYFRTTPSEPGDERGVALTELTIVVPLMMVLLLVVFDVGRGFMEYVSVSNGARDGARIAAQFDVDCTDASDRITIRDAAIAAAAPLPLSASDVVVAPGAGDTCRVTVNHTYQMVIPFVNGSFSLPFVGDVGPLWDGTMSETMVSA